ncbi:MAG: tRNA (adenosine(37)-N6)-threonylcarbamoyltransferase complex ATPase subunit type 1 TsaE [Acidimicrobiales bacterium]
MARAHDAEPSTLCAETDGPAATQRLAAALSPCLDDGDLLVLTGDLGAGKTCFTQGLGRGLGIDDRITSPTFTLAAVYRGRLVLNHLDVYRLDDPAETLDLDLPELLEDGVTVIEWGEQVSEVLPPERCTIELGFPPVGDPDGSDDRRTLRLELAGARWQRRRGAIETALADWSTPC